MYHLPSIFQLIGYIWGKTLVISPLRKSTLEFRKISSHPNFILSSNRVTRPWTINQLRKANIIVFRCQTTSVCLFLQSKKRSLPLECTNLCIHYILTWASYKVPYQYVHLWHVFDKAAITIDQKPFAFFTEQPVKAVFWISCPDPTLWGMTTFITDLFLNSILLQLFLDFLCGIILYKLNTFSVFACLVLSSHSTTTEGHCCFLPSWSKTVLFRHR